MINLKNETLEVLHEHGKCADDVLWVGTEDKAINSDVFWKIADIIYDNGYGSQDVNESLLVVGDTWWLERHEYDGAEWWEYKEHPAQPIIEADDARKLILPDPWHKYDV